jgi:hypothetical protein
VLLAPACASWDWYEGGYEARGDDFTAEVALLIRELEAIDATADVADTGETR